MSSATKIKTIVLTEGYIVCTGPGGGSPTITNTSDWLVYDEN